MVRQGVPLYYHPRRHHPIIPTTPPPSGRKWGKSWLYHLTNGRLPCATEPQDHATPYTRGGSMRPGAQKGEGPLPPPPPEHDLVSARLTAAVFERQ